MFSSRDFKWMAFFLVLSISCGGAIKCYVCKSSENPDCMEPSKLKMVDCADAPGGPKSTLCRKIVQDVPPAEGLNTKTRIIRECGYENSTLDCYQKAGFGGRQFVCSCHENGCNGAYSVNSVTVTHLTWVTSLAALLSKWAF